MGNRNDSKLMFAIVRGDHAAETLSEMITALLTTHEHAGAVAMLTTLRAGVEKVVNDLRRQSRTPAVTEAAK